MWSAPVTLTQPLGEPVSLVEAKQFVSVDAGETAFDVQLAAFIGAARQQIEVVTGTRMMPQSVRVAASHWGDLDRLPIGPASAVTALVYDDAAGAAQTVLAEEYELVGAGLERGIRPAHGLGWPTGYVPKRDGIRVTLSVGYDPVPRPLWTAMLLMVGDQFAHRESVVVGTVAAKIASSMAIDAVLANYRIW